MQKHAIETCGLTRRFGAQLAVDDLNLLAPEAGVYGFLGPNGAGKTTTIRMLLGLIRPDAGEVRLFGAPLAADRLSLMRMVGALVETPSLYPHLTGRDSHWRSAPASAEPSSPSSRPARGWANTIHGYCR